MEVLIARATVTAYTVLSVMLIPFPTFTVVNKALSQSLPHFTLLTTLLLLLLLLLLLSRFSHVQLFTTPWTAADQAFHPWDFPGKSTGVSCHCLLHLVTLGGGCYSLLLYRRGNGRYCCPRSLIQCSAFEPAGNIFSATT